MKIGRKRLSDLVCSRHGIGGLEVTTDIGIERSYCFWKGSGISDSSKT